MEEPPGLRPVMAAVSSAVAVEEEEDADDDVDEIVVLIELVVSWCGSNDGSRRAGLQYGTDFRNERFV